MSEQSLYSCCVSLGSNKVTERKKCMEQLSEMLNDPKIILLLNGKTSTSASRTTLNWDFLFESTHNLVLKEVGSCKNDKTASSTMISKPKTCSSLVIKIVRKANHGVPRLKCSNLFPTIMEVLSDANLWESVGDAYVKILLQDVMPVRKYWGELTIEDWQELLAVCIKLYNASSNRIDRKITLAKILTAIVEHGTNQSDLGLSLKQRFKFLENSLKDAGVGKSPGLQEVLLQLSLTLCTQLAVESRTATCQFGETVLQNVIDLYEYRLEDRQGKKSLIFEFFLLQVNLHHPHGVKEGEGASYAFNWEHWRQHLKSIYYIVETEIRHIQRVKYNASKRLTLPKNFLQLTSNVCKQVFASTTNFLDVTESNAESEVGSKRRRVVVGIRAIMDSITTSSNSGVPHESWPWLAVLCHLFDKYPSVVEPCDFLPLLQLMAELQSTCKDAVLMNYLCHCCAALLKVEPFVKPSLLNAESLVPIWRKIWDTTLRTVGLNQSEEGSHHLLQSLVAHGMARTPTALLQMFLSGAVQLSTHSLKTLESVCHYCNIPEHIETQLDTRQVPKNKPESVRSALLDWVFPSTEDNLNITSVSTHPALISKVVVDLLVKNKRNRPTPRDVPPHPRTIEEEYALSAFENGLLVDNRFLNPAQDVLQEQPLVYADVKEKLLTILERLCVPLLEARIPTAERCFVALKNLIVQIHLLACILSSILNLELQPSRYLVETRLIDVLNQLVAKLAEPLKEILMNTRHDSYTTDSLILLTKLTHLYKCELQDDIANELRMATPNGLLQTLYDVAKNKLPQDSCNYDDVDEDYPSEHGLKKMESWEHGNMNMDEESPLLSGNLLSDTERIQVMATAVLCAFICRTGSQSSSSRENTIMSKLLNAIVTDNLQWSICDFQSSVKIVRSALKFSNLDPEQISSILTALQMMCRSRHKDADAAVIILSLLQDLFKRLDSLDSDVLRANSIVLLTAFNKNIKQRKYGPKVCVQYIKCLDEIAKVDPSFSWTRWSCGSQVGDILDQCVLTPICEDALVHLMSPFHQVRMVAATSVATLFDGSAGKTLTRTEKHRWEMNMFDKLCVSILSSFVVEGSLTMQAKIDEGANRTASALHCLASLIVVSPRCRRKALLKILQLVKDKNVNVELVHKVLRIIGSTLGLASVTKFMENNLYYLLVHWLDVSELTEFPWQLMDSFSEKDFFSKYCDEIVPVLLQKEQNEMLSTLCQKINLTMSQLMEMCYPRVIACFLPCFAIDINDPSYGVTDADKRVAKHLHANLEKLMGKPHVDNLMTEHLGQIIVHLLRLLFDLKDLVQLCGPQEMLPDPELPYFSACTVRKTLDYLQEGSPNPDLPLIEFFVNEYPQHIQKILLCLSVDINEAATLQDRLFALHRYAFFADIISSCNPREMAQFVLRDITHTLIFVVKKSSSKQEKVLAASACHFLRTFFGKCLPRHASILQDFVNLVVGILTPLAVLEDNLGSEALKCIKLLIVDNKECLVTAVGSLNPFPNNDVFEEVQQVYETTIKRDSRCTLEDHIKHFLDASAGRLGSKAEGLLHIRSKLSDKKNELQVMYHELEESRGFSEDCANSLLHQLVCKLVELTSDSDIRIRLEASRCLGELGPADLGSMVLKPEAKQERVNDPLRATTSLAISLLVDYLVHEDIVVVQAASAALYALLATKHGQHATDRKDSKFVIPFKSAEAVGVTNPKIIVDLDIFKQLIESASLWCPAEDCTHEKWITDLVCSLLQTFSENCYLHHLIPVCQAKVSFSEKMLPLLVELILCYGGDECASVVSQCMRYFFSKQFATSILDNKIASVEELKHSKEQICCNRASVQCMLDVVHFIRLQRSLILKKDGTSVLNQSPSMFAQQLIVIADVTLVLLCYRRQLHDNTTNLDLDYLHVARAAQFCLAYFTSILYAELWCEEIHLKRSTRKHLARQNQTTSKLDNISNIDLEGGLAVQNLLREAYIRIGDSDAVYGCGSSHLLNPQTRVRHYEMLGKWDDVLLLYDIELSSGNLSATRGMLFALERFGLHHLQQGYQDSSGDSVNYECLWRLGLWNAPIEPVDHAASALKDIDNVMSHGEYAKYHYLSLKALNNKDATGVENAVANARHCVVESLANVSLESSKNLYPALSQLQALQEIEDFAMVAAQNGSFESLFDKWKCQDQLNVDEFSYVEPIFAQRAAMLNIISEMDNPAQNDLAEIIVQVQLTTAARARVEKCHQVAMRCLGKLNKTMNLSTDIVGKIKLEEACLAWEHGNKEVARVLLQSLLSKYSETPPTSESEVVLYSLALQKYGNWMIETKSENPQVIIECYLLKSLSVLCNVDNTVGNRIETYGSLARFADAQYQQITHYVKSAETQRKRQACTDALSNVVDENSKASKLMRDMSKIDRKEIENAEKDRTTFLLQAIKYYVLSLEQGNKDKENMLVFRLVSLWLENSSHDELNETLDSSLDGIPSYKFLSVLPQLAPRMGNNPNDGFVNKINNLLERCAVDHPHHTLPLIFALANSLRDQMYVSKGNNIKRRPEPRVLGAQEMMKNLRKNQKIGTIVQQMQILSEALIELANFGTDRCKAGAFPFPKECKLPKLKNLSALLVPTMTLCVRQNGAYDDIVGVQGFENSFELVGGVNAPKKISCRCTDGIRRPQLVKGKDDLRQDAVMQQVFTMMNTVLKNNKETQKRKLIIRTYKVVPLSQCSGILEWCLNTEPIGAYLVGPRGRTGAHCHYFPNDLTNAECRTLAMEASKGTNERKLKVFQDICSRLHPVFHYFFLENFPTPGLWFERRLAFIHSVATTSMIGYILGLGDRHVNNILIDKITAEVVHIDFGIAFEQGKVLPLPETVPFRLTRDIEDGMGVSGVEGVFRRSCEKTMSVLRQNQETILTILEVLLYDPLYDWTITPAKAFNIQQEKRSKNGNTVDSENSTTEVNKLAERALQRLRQKLQGTEEGTAMSVAGQVNWLIQQARDPGNLSKVYFGWQAHL